MLDEYETPPFIVVSYSYINFLYNILSQDEYETPPLIVVSYSYIVSL